MLLNPLTVAVRRTAERLKTARPPWRERPGLDLGFTRYSGLPGTHMEVEKTMENSLFVEEQGLPWGMSHHVSSRECAVLVAEFSVDLSILPLVFVFACFCSG